MSTIELRDNLHELINTIENPRLLESLYELLTQSQNSKNANLWSSLSEDQKQEVLDAYEESENHENLTEHTAILRKFK